MLLREVHTVRDLFQALMPGGAPGLAPGTWFFRGQGNAAWGLVPTLFRRRAYDRVGTLAHVATASSSAYLTVAEQEHALALESAIDRNLMAVLRDRGAAFERSEHLAAIANRAAEGPAVSDERLALAQHLGLPTRMLDWSRSPWVALFFAVQHARPDAAFGIFAMHSTYAMHSLRMQPSPIATPSGYMNDNFTAQSGLFVRLNAPVIGPDGDSGWDMAIGHEELTAVRPRHGLMDDNLVKITSPSALAAPVRAALREWGYHAGRLFPSNEGAAAAVHDLLRDS